MFRCGHLEAIAVLNYTLSESVYVLRCGFFAESVCLLLVSLQVAAALPQQPQTRHASCCARDHVSAEVRGSRSALFRLLAGWHPKRLPSTPRAYWARTVDARRPYPGTGPVPPLDAAPWERQPRLPQTSVPPGCRCASPKPSIREMKKAIIDAGLETEDLVERSHVEERYEEALALQPRRG